MYRYITIDGFVCIMCKKHSLECLRNNSKRFTSYHFNQSDESFTEYPVNMFILTSDLFKLQVIITVSDVNLEINYFLCT